MTDTQQEDPSGAKAFWSRGYLNGAQQKVKRVQMTWGMGALEEVRRVCGGGNWATLGLTTRCFLFRSRFVPPAFLSHNFALSQLVQIANYHVGEVIQSLHKTTLTPSGTQCIAYTTLSGAVGALMPFKHKEDVEFFQTLELHLRQEDPPLCGRDHLAFRSAYFPCKVCCWGVLLRSGRSLGCNHGHMLTLCAALCMSQTRAILISFSPLLVPLCSHSSFRCAGRD